MINKNLYNESSGYPEGKWACRFCRHDLAHHNNIVGCPHCRCGGTQGECSPSSDADFAAPIIRTDTYLRTFEPNQPEYTKPEIKEPDFFTRIIRTVEHLESAVPHGGVVVSRTGRAYEKASNNEWFYPGSDEFWPSSFIDLPALYVKSNKEQS